MVLVKIGEMFEFGICIGMLFLESKIGIGMLFDFQNRYRLESVQGKLVYPYFIVKGKRNHGNFFLSIQSYACK